MTKTIGSANKAIISALMRVLRVHSFQQLENELETAPGTVSRIYHGKNQISHRIFLRAAIITDMRPSELMKKLGIDDDYFWSVTR